jgi:VanZ family protein
MEEAETMVQASLAREWRPARRVRWVVWGAFVLAWTVALLVPIPAKPAALPQEWWELKFYFAKSLHASAYAFLAILSAWLHVARPRRWLLLLFLVGHAAGTEFLQWLLPTGRTGCVSDVGIDVLGILVGTALSWKWWRE